MGDAKSKNKKNLNAHLLLTDGLALKNRFRKFLDAIYACDVKKV